MAGVRRLGAMQVRNLEFDVGEAIPRTWHPGGRAVTLFLNNLSVFFPAGERFFIASVKAFRHRVAAGSDLERDVKAFAAQEGIHSREHVHYNQMLAAQGYPVIAMERRVENILGLVRRALPRRWHLSATCALEHFTAIMAHYLLSDPRLLEGANPVMAQLWRWHAAEENEHKAVAFDVYQLAGAPYLERTAVMVLTSVIFWAKVIEQQVRMMHADGILWSLREWRALGRFLFVDPGGAGSVVRHYFSYYRPLFHPWQLDNRDLLEAWKQELAADASYGHAA